VTTAVASQTAGVIAPPPLIYLGALGIGFGLDAIIGTGSLPTIVAVPVGAASIIAGAGLLRFFRRAFQRAEHPLTRTRRRRRSSPMVRPG
jgi:hypothetical protein